MNADVIVKPRKAATVMLLRDTGAAMEVFMIVRHQNSDVHAGALVFPGGRVDDEDYDLAVDAAVFPALTKVDADGAVLRVAAVRETFEECGILLARARGSESLVSAERLRDIEARHRAPMTLGERSFGAIIAAEDLVIAAESMVYFANWVTPERSAKRFDTHFFLAAAPPDQIALHDGHEAVDSVWITPAAALERAKAGIYQLRFPTQMNLQKLGRHASSSMAMLAAQASPVVTVMSKQEKTSDGRRMLRLPLAADYGGELFEG